MRFKAQIQSLFRFSLAGLSLFILAGQALAATPDEIKKSRQLCSRMAEKLGNARKLPNNTIQSSGNYNIDKGTCFVQIEISQRLEGMNENGEEKRHRQILLMETGSATLLALVMWEEPKGLRVGHIYDPSYDGPRDDYEKVDLYIRKKMALTVR